MVGEAGSSTGRTQLPATSVAHRALTQWRAREHSALFPTPLAVTTKVVSYAEAECALARLQDVSRGFGNGGDGEGEEQNGHRNHSAHPRRTSDNSSSNVWPLHRRRHGGTGQQAHARETTNARLKFPPNPTAIHTKTGSNIQSQALRISSSQILNSFPSQTHIRDPGTTTSLNSGLKLTNPHQFSRKLFQTLTNSPQIGARCHNLSQSLTNCHKSSQSLANSSQVVAHSAKFLATESHLSPLSQITTSFADDCTDY